MELSSLYRDTILKHARSPQNEGVLENPDYKARAVNKLCGDELELTLSLEGDQIKEARLNVRGCAVVQAASSMMSELLSGLTLQQASERGAQLKACLQDGATPDQDLASLLPLITLKDHRARHRCVLLPWEALDLCALEKDQHLNA